MLRDYQQAAFNSTVDYISKCFDPCLLELATGAGKSHLVAALAEWLNEKSGKKVLCLAPSKELIEQNYKKFLSTGKPASFYSASIGKSLAHDVIFGTPKSVLNDIKKFGSNFSAVIIDEAHGMTPTVKAIIDEIKNLNKNLRIIGLTATPYRMGEGYIFKKWPTGAINDEFSARHPFFHSLLCRVTAQDLIERGFLTPPSTVEGGEHYDTERLIVGSMGRFDAKEIEKTFEGRGRLTSKIVNDFVSRCAGKNGVIVFAQTINHANEIMESLPENAAKLITGKTKKRDRQKTITDFKNKRFKYLVNISVLTTGFDAPHVDAVIVMRATESVGLLQQIVGRGLRLDDGKEDCLILDYAENIRRHCPDGDIFNPSISALPQKTKESIKIKAVCESCEYENEFSGRPNPEEFAIDDNGYFLDLNNKRVVIGDGVFLPAHFGRRCEGEILASGTHERCAGRWSFKSCPDCESENDITARECGACGCELIDPNEKLKLEFERIKSSPSEMTTDKVLSWKAMRWKSQAGNQTVKIDITTEYRTFPVWFSPRSRRQWDTLCFAVVGRIGLDIDGFFAHSQTMPKTVTSKKDGKYYKVYAFNRPEDIEP